MVDYTLAVTTQPFTLTLRSLTLVRSKFDFLQDYPNITDSITAELRYLFSDGIVVGSDVVSPQFITSQTITEPFRFYESQTIGFLKSLTSSWNVATTASADVGILLLEVIEFLETVTPSGIFNVSVNLQLYFNELISLVIPGNLSSSITLSELTTIIQGVSVLEQLSIEHTQTPTCIFRLSLLQLIQYNDVLQHYIGLALSDTFSLIDQSSPQFVTYPLVQDSIILSEVLGHSIIFSVTSSETITLDDVDIIQQILTGLLDDTIEIVVGYVSPDGNFTTWVMNTRSSATTEYQNYQFNSFTRVGNKYLGASSTGLYELNGDDDAGDTIVSTIASGLMQVAGSKFTSFKAAYLGLRGQGEYLLKLISGEGQEYIYKVRAETMKSARVNLGKGLRSRYFSYQLENIDTDFDLDTIEFIPIGANRRV